MAGYSLYMSVAYVVRGIFPIGIYVGDKYMWNISILSPFMDYVARY